MRRFNRYLVAAAVVAVILLIASSAIAGLVALVGAASLLVMAQRYHPSDPYPELGASTGRRSKSGTHRIVRRR